MGVPEGWITGVGLTRNEELKACGNGVVPQQAELALRMLLDDVLVELKKAESDELSTFRTDNSTIGDSKSTAEEGR